MSISTARPTRIATIRAGCACCGRRRTNSARTCASMYDKAETTAYYFVIPRSDESNPFSDFTTPGNANDTTSPIQNNNLGTDDRDILDVALKLDFNLGYGTITSITDYNHTKEIDTGDAYDFRPVTTSVEYCAHFVCGPDTDACPGRPVRREPEPVHRRQDLVSQELRFTSPVVEGFSWIAGAYYVHTERFISTGNLADRGEGVPAGVLHADRRSDQSLRDQHQPDLSRGQPGQQRLGGVCRCDLRVQQAMGTRCRDALRPGSTPEHHRHADRSSCRPPRPSPARCARPPSVRPQPKATLRFKPNDDWTIYGGWSRGFRSGGFNQTGVGDGGDSRTACSGVNDLFQAEIADTYEVGFKSQFLDRRLTVDGDVFHTQSKNGYFFVFIAADSTQNLGNLSADLQGGRALHHRSSDRSARPVCRRRLHRQPHHRHGRPDRHRQSGAAGVEEHRQRRRAVQAAAWPTA